MLATVDIERLGREIAEAAKRTRETSPEFLQKRIAELERAGKGSDGGEASRDISRLQAEVDRLMPLAEQATKAASELRALEQKHSEFMAAMRELVERFAKVDAPAIPDSAATVFPKRARGYSLRGNQCRS